MSARDIIAGAIQVHLRPNNPTISGTHLFAHAILTALTASGYRILAPDELDPVTLEKAAGVADEAAAMRMRLFEENETSINAHRACQAEETATAIRSLEPAPEDGT